MGEEMPSRSTIDTVSCLVDLEAPNLCDDDINDIKLF